MSLTTVVKLGIGALVLSIGACCPPSDPKTVTVVCQSDSGIQEDLPFEADQSPEALGRATPCSRACASLSLLGCPESKQKPGSFTCIEACGKLAKISSFDPECVALAKNVDAVRKCPQVTCKK